MYIKASIYTWWKKRTTTTCPYYKKPILYYVLQLYTSNIFKRIESSSLMDIWNVHTNRTNCINCMTHGVTLISYNCFPAHDKAERGRYFPFLNPFPNSTTIVIWISSVNAPNHSTICLGNRKANRNQVLSDMPNNASSRYSNRVYWHAKAYIVCLCLCLFNIF